MVKNLSVLLLVGVITTVAFNNCSKPKDDGESSSSSSSASNQQLSAEPCEDQLMNFYSRSYQPFLVQNCKSCHSTGPGKGQFANPDTSIAYKDFMQIGYSKVSSNAISEGHNLPYTGSKHTVAVNELKITWLKALSEYDMCLGGTGEVQQNLSIKDRSYFGLIGKPIPMMNDGEERIIEYDLTKDLSQLKDKNLPILKGAKFSIAVHKVLRGTERYYSVHSPRIYGSSDDIHVKGLFTLINGRYINYSTNFRYLDAKIPKTAQATTSSSLLSTGAIVVAGAIFPEDKISFDFEILETTEIPLPPPPVNLSFTGTTTVLANSTGEVSFNISLDKPTTEVITFTYTPDTTALCNGGVTNSTNCLPDVYSLVCPGNSCGHLLAPNFEVARSVVGTSFNRFDWDYKLGTTSLSFAPGETLKTITLKTSRDERFESNRVLTLRLEAGLGAVQIPQATAFARIVFNKRINREPPSTEVTFSKLMGTGGALLNTCTRCHNSVRRDGGYDIQDYELMISSDKRILVPGADSISYTDKGKKVIVPVSLMYRRTLSEFTTESLLMPREDQFSADDFVNLEAWLLSGAKNN